MSKLILFCCLLWEFIMENMLSKDEITAIVNGDHGNVFAVLGIHRNKGTKKVFIRAYQPFAASIDVIDRN